MNYSYLTTMYESILAQIYVFLVLFTSFAFYHEKKIKQKLQKKKMFFYHKLVYFGENTLIQNCSRIIVAQIHVNVFSKIHPARHSDANGIKRGSNQKMTDKHAAEYSKSVCWDVN